MKKITVLMLVFMLAFIICPTVSADSAEDELEIIKDRIDSRLTDDLDSDTIDELDAMGVKPSDSTAITSLDIRSVFSRLSERFKAAIRVPAVMLGRILAVSLIYSAMLQLSSDMTGTSKVFSTICIICVITIMADSMSSSFTDLQDSISCINTFMLSYIPIFTAVTAAGGAPVTAGVYSASTVLVCEVTEFISSQLLIPMLSSLTAMTIVSAIEPKLKISGFAESVRKLTTWMLASTMLVFVGLLTVQGVTGSAADSLTSRTLRFAASSFIPVIGASVSDAFMAVKGGMGLIRSAVGGFGMLAVFLIAARPFISIFSMKLALWAGRIVNELLGLHQTAEFLKSINSVLSIAVSILISISAAFLIATAAVLSVSTSGGQ